MTTLTAPSRPIPARLTGLGVAQPAGVVSGAELMAPFGKTAQWLRDRTGIDELRRLTPHEDLLELTRRAACRALGAAGLGVPAVEAIIVATCSANTGTGPALATQLASRLGAAVPAFDLNSACAGFCFALAEASGLIATGTARTVLVVGTERMSGLVDPNDLGTSILFGDGAGAAVVQASDGASGIGPAAWSTDGSPAGRGVLEVREGNTHLSMAGQQVFRWAVDSVPAIADRAMARAGVRPGDIDVFVPHQANLRIIDAISRRLRLRHATTATDVTQSGNTSAASIPIALAKLREAGRLRSGQLALLIGFGAGLSIAGQVVRLP